MRMTARRGAQAAGVAAIFLAALLAGCGGDAGEGTAAGASGTGGEASLVSGPLPDTEASPRAYTDAWLAANPGALARLSHLIVLRSDGPLTQVDPGAGVRVTRLPYHVDRPVTVELSIHASARPVARLELRHESGALVALHERGDAPIRAVLVPGGHALEVHHAAPAPAAASGTDAKSALAAAPGAPSAAVRLAAADPPATLFLRASANPSTATVSIEASGDCPGCNFSNADLSGYDFQDKDLRGSLFLNARLVDTVFRGALLTKALLVGTNVAAAGADFSRSRASGRATLLDGASLDLRVEQCCEAMNFNEANLSSADLIDARMTRSSFVDANLSNTLLAGTSFAGSDLRGAILDGAAFMGPGHDNTNFAGTRLSGASPISGRIASMARVDATFQNFNALDLQGVDLSGATLRDATFTGTNLRQVRLVNATPATLFSGQNLSGTDFSGADFAGLDLSQANLAGATLSADTRFEGATLTDGVGRGINLAGNQTLPALFAHLKGKDLRFANLSGMSLYQADLQGVDLSGAQLVGANLSFANLKGARLVGARLGSAPGSSGTVTRLQGAYMPDVDLTDADLRSADLSGAHLYGISRPVSLARAQLDSAVLAGAILSGTQFTGSLNDAVLTSAVLVNADFSGANLTNAKFDSAYLQGASFASAASVTGVSLNNAAVSTAPGAWSYTEQDGSPVTYGFGATVLGALATSGVGSCPNGQFGPCTGAKLVPVASGPFPPQPACIPLPPKYDNCLPPKPPG